jgi:alkaline phosphatase D
MRRLSIVVTAVAGLLALPAGASAAGFSLGVAAGEISANSARLWAHATAPGRTMAQVSTSRSFRNPLFQRNVNATRSHDLTVQTIANGLRPGRTYYYRWLQGRRASDVGRFETAPPANANTTVRFAFTGDADATRARGQSRPFFNTFALYGRVQRENNDFNFNFGDTIYSDSEVGARFVNGRFVPATVARTVAQKWEKYKLGLGQGPLAKLRGSTGLYSHWDDHEFINDFSIPEDGRTIYRNGVTAFRDYAPVTYTSRDGLYRKFRWGRNAEIFMLDQRSFRSAKASSGGTCNNPQTNAPDLAPTAPQTSRNLFTLIVPSLSQPVSQACKDRIADPSRTMLGSRQFQRFVADVRRSDATFKIIMNETPIQQFYALPYDRWEGYAAERQRILDVLDDVKNVVFLTTDTHANFVNDVRFQTLEPGGPIDTGLDEFVTGPVATNTFAKEIDETVQRPGSGQLVTAAFFKPAPNPSGNGDGGVGMKCANPDVVSYAEVSVNARRVAIEAKDINGRVVLDSTDKATPCRLVVPRR